MEYKVIERFISIYFGILNWEALLRDRLIDNCLDLTFLEPYDFPESSRYKFIHIKSLLSSNWDYISTIKSMDNEELQNVVDEISYLYFSVIENK